MIALPTAAADFHGCENPKNVIVFRALPVDPTNIVHLNLTRALQLSMPP